MSRHTNVERLIACVLVALMVTFTVPVSAAELGDGAAPVGSIRAVGHVELRGIAISWEGTVFDGDRISSSAASNGTVAFVSGDKFDLAANTDVVVRQDGDVIQLAINAGSIAFSSVSESLRISLAPYEFQPGPTATGVISLVGPESVGVVSTKGSMMVRNTSTGQAFLLTEGQERRMGRSNGVVADPISVIAANFPGRALPPIPSSPPPVPQASNLSSAAWAAIVAAVAGGAAVATWAAVGRDKVNKSELDSANTSLTTANATITGLNSDKTALNASITTKNAEIASLGTQITTLGSTNSALASQLVDVQNAAIVELSATHARLRTIEVELAAVRTSNAIAASALTEAQKVTFTAQTEVIRVEVTAAKAEIAVLETAIGGVKDKLAALGSNVSAPRGITSALTAQDLINERDLLPFFASDPTAKARLQALIDRMPTGVWLPGSANDFIGTVLELPFPNASNLEEYFLLLEADVLTHEINVKVVEITVLQTSFNDLLVELNANNVQPDLVTVFVDLPAAVLKPPPTPASLSVPITG